MPIALLAGLLLGGRAQGQARFDAALASELALALDLPPLLPQQYEAELPPLAREAAAQHRQRGARVMLALGTGLTAAALLRIGISRVQDHYDGEYGRPTISYGVAGAGAVIGTVLTFAGARRLATLARSQRRSTTPGRKFGLVILALTTFVAAEIVLAMPAMIDQQRLQ